MKSGYCEEIVKITRLSSCKNFVSKRDKFIFDAFVHMHMHSADYAVARCLFVCLSVTRQYCIETVNFRTPITSALTICADLSMLVMGPSRYLSENEAIY